MTSSNGNIFRVTGHLCGEFTRSTVNSPHKGQWRGALIFTLICARINGWVNNREAGDLRRYRGHYDVTVMAAVDSRRISDQYIWISYFSQKVICVTNLPWQWSDLLDIETFSRYLHVDVLHRHHGPWTQSLWIGQYQWCAIMHWWLRSESGLRGHWLCPVPKTLLYEWRNRYKIAPEKCNRPTVKPLI